MSDGPVYHNAIAAWQDGFTGAGSIIAIIDTGIDSDSPEFAGRIHPNSRDVAGNRGIDGIDDHGTNVAMVAAAARDNTGIMGIAFDAQVLAIRADEPGSCVSDTPDDPTLNCQFFDTDIATGVDLAVSTGARVINLSLGGGGASQSLLDAVSRAASAGVVIVVSAGNGGDGSDPDIDPNEPDPFAASLLQAGGANVIIVGSIDEFGGFSSFSNRAGSAQNSFISARGEEICCVYQNGELFVETIDGQQFVTVFSGTSFSAPQVAGAVALLAQAFPNLTGAEIVEIILNSAIDAGEVGVDGTYGRGVLDIAQAMQPAGRTALAGQTTRVRLDDRILTGSPAMGDALLNRDLVTLITDKYDRAYQINLGAGLAGSTVKPVLYGAVAREQRALSLGGAGVTLAFNVADSPIGEQRERFAPLRLSNGDVQQAQVLAARVAAHIAPDTQIALAFGQSAGGLDARVKGQARPAFAIAGGPGSDSGFFIARDASLAVRHDLGAWGLTLRAESGDARLGYAQSHDEILFGHAGSYPVRNIGLSADRQWGGVVATLGLSWLREEKSVLGARLHDALSQGGADSLFLDGGADWQLGKGWSLASDLRFGVTRAQRSPVIAQGSQLLSTAWSVDLSHSGVFSSADMLGLRVSQPLRVESGGLRLNLPSSFDYATETPGYSIQRFSLAPHGRELVSELAWRGQLLSGQAAASVYYRHEPGHYANSPSDVGAVISYSAGF